MYSLINSSSLSMISLPNSKHPLTNHMALPSLLFISFLLLPTLHSKPNCQISSCSTNTPQIRFPFHLQTKQPLTCGYPYPGFNLTCANSNNMTLLSLPYSGLFSIRNINYRTQTLQLYDPNNCLPKRLLNFNLSNSPFAAPFYRNYTFLVCPAEVTRSRFSVIGCLSNATNTTLATSKMDLALSMMDVCSVINTVQVPVSWPVEYDEGGGFSSVLDEDIELGWSVPDCQDCESRGGRCGNGMDNNSTNRLSCCYDHQRGGANGLLVFRIIALSIVVPAIVCSITIGCFIFTVERNRNGRRNHPQTAAVTPQPAVTTPSGLDESTIESYAKVILGESRRLPGPTDDATCPICLADYCAKETLRSIPDCWHCFHAECIDEWLRMHATCPVCRNSPSHFPVIR